MAFDTTAALETVAPNLGYRSGTLTPTITFGGAAVGVTYGTQSGAWVRIGNLLFIECVLILTAKGSSTGEARIVTGLSSPYLSARTVPLALSVNNMANGTTNQHSWAEVVGSAASMRLYESSNTTPEVKSIKQDTAFTDTSEIRISGQWMLT